jgi:hypothetical protein
MSMSNGSHTTLIDHDSWLFITQAWHAPDYVLLTGGHEPRWEMDVNTGQVTQVESTGCPSMFAGVGERVSRADWVFSGRVEKIEFLDPKKSPTKYRSAAKDWV